MNNHRLIFFYIHLNWRKKGLNGSHLVGVADHGHVDVRIPSDLLLRDNYLGGKGILCIRNRMIEQTNATDNLSDLANAVRGIRWVTIDLQRKGISKTVPLLKRRLLSTCLHFAVSPPERTPIAYHKCSIFLLDTDFFCEKLWLGWLKAFETLPVHFHRKLFHQLACRACKFHHRSHLTWQIPVGAHPENKVVGWSIAWLF